MEKTSISEAEFPVFQIRTYESIYSKDGIVYIDTGTTVSVLDVPGLGVSLGARRLEYYCMQLGRLYPLYSPFFNLGEILAKSVAHKKYKTYIDSKGFIFKYTPSRFIKTRSIRVRKQVIKEGQHTLVYLEGELQPLKVPRPLNHGDKYATIVRIGGKSFLLKYTEEKCRNGSIKV